MQCAFSPPISCAALAASPAAEPATAVRQRRSSTGGATADVIAVERLALGELAADLAHEHHHRRRILQRGMHADRAVGGPRSAGHEQHARPAGELAVGFGHESRPALLPAGHEADFGRVIERVEHFEIALAGDAERHELVE